MSTNIFWIFWQLISRGSRAFYKWTAAPGGPAFYAYSTNYLIDTKAGVIVDVEATPAYRTDEVNATRVMVDRVEERFEIKPTHLIGDTAYGTAEMLGWMVDEKAIEPHVPVAERKDGSLGRSDFHWEAEADEYRCPQGKPLRSTGKPTADDTLIYRSSVYDCADCELKSRCCPTPRIGRSPGRSMNPHATWLVSWQRHPETRDRADIGRRSRCRLLTSNASCAWTACVSAA